MGVTQGAGLSLQWFRNRLMPGTDYDDLTAEAILSPTGAQGLFWLPYLMGERTPHLDAAARGAWVGLTAKHQRSDLIRAILEGVCYSQRDCLEIIRGLGAPVTNVRLSGGGARSPFWHQMFADIFGCRVVTLATQEGSAFGAALLAQVGTGEYKSVREACSAVIKEVETKNPATDAAGVLRTSLSGLSGPLPRAAAVVSNYQPPRCLRSPHRYADVSLPVPVDQSFTYELPLTLRHRVSRGSRLLVPFGSRRVIGVVLKVHDRPPAQEAREALQLLDEQPVLEDELLRLGHWIAEYYCAPLGEVLRGMLPLTGEVRRSKLYTLTEAGRGVARQLTVSNEIDSATAILRILEEKPRSAEYLADKIRKAKQTIKGLLKRGWIAVEEQHAERDPLRASAARLEIEFLCRPEKDLKLKKSERELLAFLELHPGAHNLAQLGQNVRNASTAARSLCAKRLVRLEPENIRIGAGYERPIPTLERASRVGMQNDPASAGTKNFRFVPFAGRHGLGQDGSVHAQHRGYA